jgi:hypothetical protein
MDRWDVIEWVWEGGYGLTYRNDRDPSSVAVFVHLALFLAVEETVVILDRIQPDQHQPEINLAAIAQAAIVARDNRDYVSELTCIATNFVHPFFSAQNCIMANWYVHMDEAPMYRIFPAVTRSWSARIVSSIGV